MPAEGENFQLKWKTFTHINHPYGDLVWHLFWGIIIGIFSAYAIFYHDYWLLIVSLIALIFFFHPKFYEPRLMTIILTSEGVQIDKKFYPWKKFSQFEVFGNNRRRFIFLVPNHLSVGIHFPLETFFVDDQEVINFLKKFLKETSDSVPIFLRIYRQFFT
ncbi:MAG: AsmA family protein [Patescibacteria group bacterium]|nr:AsmA family protein [Patescibacteria group bacterium]